MELLGEDVSQLWGRRPPYIVGGGQSNHYPHNSPAEGGTTAGGSGTTADHSGTTAPPGGTTVESGGQESGRLERYCRGGRAVLPLSSGTTASTTAAKCRSTRHEMQPP